MTDALLNPEVEARAARTMIDVVTTRIGRLHTELTTSVLEREQYLLKIGAARELEQLQSSMQREYDRHFKV